MNRLALGAVTAALVLSAPLRAQGRPASPDTGLASALAAFDSANVAGGVAALRAALAALPEGSRASRARAQMYLAAAEWWLLQVDSAAATMRAAVATDPFVQVDTVRFNPDLATALLRARREVAALGVRAPADVTVRPDSQVWALVVAVGRPGTVRVHWKVAGLDTVLASAPVDSSETLRVPLASATGAVVRPGSGEVSLELMDGTQQLAALKVAVFVERLPVDTAEFVSEPLSTDYRVESRRGNVSAPALLRGLVLAAAAAALPMVVANSSLPSSTVRRGAAVVGGTLALGSVVGALVGRSVVPIEENIQFNRLVRDTWASRNRAIAAANDYRRRFAPLRLRATVAAP